MSWQCAARLLTISFLLIDEIMIFLLTGFFLSRAFAANVKTRDTVT